MTETNWTRGPWVHIPNDNFRRGAVLIWTSKGPGYGAICELSGPNPFPATVRQHEANARLIVQAPALYEALEAALEAMNYLGDVLNANDMATAEGIAIVSPAFDKARAVLAAARGTE